MHPRKCEHQDPPQSSFCRAGALPRLGREDRTFVARLLDGHCTATETFRGVFSPQQQLLVRTETLVPAPVGTIIYRVELGSY